MTQHCQKLIFGAGALHDRATAHRLVSPPEQHVLQLRCGRSVMILLLWVYYSCQILLFGAEFTRVFAQRDGAKPAPESFAEKDPDAAG